MCAAGEDFYEIMTQNLHRFPGGVTHSFTDSTEDQDRLLSFEKMFIGVNGSSLKTNRNLEVLRGIPVERLMMETYSPYCDIINTHAGSQYVKSVWPSKKKEKYEPDSTVKGRNEPCLVRYFEKQFELAEAVKLPMFLHMRAVGEDLCEIMTQNLHRFPGGVTHSFTDSAEDRDRLLSFEKMFIGKFLR
ncbi:Sodium/hydrogen exchanger 2 [Zea mays]|uniref:Sodium/hydrogen exchanger 2 n=1 Tax=Zea mays TaxID=4577 RepID=A0A1D6JCT1_MAIZE|nr:Sodium/hydrogen exchanger 2 [Zea mays]AQK45632.1 Sodium/hydrogen exchanger 2 [Zea mays]